MTFPSSEFDAAISAMCHGTATDDEVAAVHGLVCTDSAARDEYLWEVELHARLASEVSLPTTSGAVVAREQSRPTSRRSLLVRPGARVQWAVAALLVLAIADG